MPLTVANTKKRTLVCFFPTRHELLSLTKIPVFCILYDKIQYLYFSMPISSEKAAVAAIIGWEWLTIPSQEDLTINVGHEKFSIHY